MLQRRAELDALTEQLHRSAAVLTAVEPLTAEYEKAVERHNMLYPSVKARPSAAPFRRALPPRPSAVLFSLAFQPRL